MRGRPLSTFGLPPPVLDALTANSFLSSTELIRLSPQSLATETGLSLQDAVATLATVSSALGVTQAIDLNPRSRSRSNTPRSSFPPPSSSTSIPSGNSTTPPTAAPPPPLPPSPSCLRSGCADLDALLSCTPPVPGLLPGHIYELAGVPGIGITTICVQLCARIALTPHFGGLSACALYIDTESGLLTDRMTDIALATAELACDAGQSLGDFATAILDNILVYRTFTLIDLIAVVDLLPTILCETPSIKLIVVDSLSFPCEGGKLEQGKAIMTTLRQLATQLGLIVVVTSKVHVYHPPKLAVAAKQPALTAAAAMSPALALEAKLPDHCPMGMDVWSDKARVVACLFWDLDVRVGFLYKGMQPNQFARFRVTEKGVEAHNGQPPPPSPGPANGWIRPPSVVSPFTPL